MSMIVILSRLKAFFAMPKYVDISIRRSNSSSGTDDNFSWVMGEALSPSLVKGGCAVVFSGGLV